jgi:cyanophycinase
MPSPLVDMLNTEKALDIFKEVSVNACSLFFCGGDQNKIVHALKNVPGLKLHFEALYCNGIPFAGTSAGCAVMSQTMITGEGDFQCIDHSRVETTSGLGFVKNAVLDQHFVKRQRMNRLLSVLLGCEEKYGIGIDEDMAVAITDDTHCEVLGTASCVVVFEKTESISWDKKSLLTHIFRAGDAFSINSNAVHSSL